MKNRFLSISAVAFSVLAGYGQTYWDGSTDKEWVGSGTPGSPYLITSAQELAGLAERTNNGETFEDNHFLLTSDIWLSNPATSDDKKPLWTPVGMTEMVNGDTEENPGGFYKKESVFKGVFDGAGHTVYNLWYAHDSEFKDNFDDPFNDGTYDFDGWSIALFGNLENAEVRNLSLSDVNVQATYMGAGLACTAKNTILSDISVDGYIICGTSEDMGGSAGGIVTEATESVFVRCTSSASVKSVSAAGGIAGQIFDCKINDCSSHGRVAAMRCAGGMIGYVHAGSVVSDSNSSTEVTQLAAKHQGNYIGGFAGVVSGSTVRTSSSTGNLYISNNGAGFVGSVTNDGLVESCYAICEISKDGYEFWMSSFVGTVGETHHVGEEPIYGYVRNCYGAVTYKFEEAPSDIITVGNHIGGFANYIIDGSQVTNCYYNSETATGVNTINVDGNDMSLEVEFGVTTAFMQSELFVSQLNEMASVIGSALWAYTPGAYPSVTTTVAPVSMAPFAGGSGTQTDPWQISNKEQLYKLADIANHGWDFQKQYILQTEDIALNAPFEDWGEEMPQQWTPIGKSFDSGSTFTFAGNYDGGLHTVSNMYMEDNVTNYAGFFGVIADGSNICNLGVTDAFIRFENTYVKGGILVGSAALWNDDSTGERRVSNCWTSGHIEGTDVSGFVGSGSQWGRTVLDNCYTTAEIYSYSGGGGFFATEVVGDMPVYVNASYFNGTFVKNGYGRYPSVFNECNVTNSYFSSDAYPVSGDYEYYTYGRTSEYMNTPEFVNELSYAASYSGLDSPWRYREGETASFFGSAPEVEVTFIMDKNMNVTFNAFKDSYLTPPVMDTQDENVILNGWIDTNTSGIFNFAKDMVSVPLQLEANWTEMIQPDYTPFKNKFSKTYTIKTPEQLLALSYIVNGVSEEVAQTDYEGYTIQLGNDIVWNDIEDYDMWGEAWTPMPFYTIGDYDKHFAGTFDGQGHKITGLFINKCGVSGGGRHLGMFPNIPAKAIVKNLMLDKAYVEVGYSYDKTWTGLLAGESMGEVLRCGAEGKIVATDAAYPEGYVGGLIAVTSGDLELTTLNECYAVVESKLNRHNFGGLVCSTSGNINDCYARSVVNWKDYGWFGGVVCIQQGSVPNNARLHNVWCASDLSWQFTFGREANPGGAVYGSDYTGNSGAFYDSIVLGDAFGPEAEWKGNRYNPYLMGIGLNTYEMHRMSSFTDWDFNGVWGRRNDKNSGYPYLRWTSPGLDNDSDSDLTGIENVIVGSDTVITLYDMSGLKVYTGTLSECWVSAGLYIICTPERYYKIVIR